MQRRKFITTTGIAAAGLAGCLGFGGGNGRSGDVVNNVEALKLSDVKTTTETVMGTTGFVVRGNLTNTSSSEVPVIVKGVFYDGDGARIGTNTHKFGKDFSGSAIKPGEEVQFEVGAAPASEIKRYKVIVGPEYAGKTTTTQSQTQTQTQTQKTTAPELSLYDDFEDGDYSDNPEWSVESGTWDVVSAEWTGEGTKAFRGRGTDPTYVRSEAVADFGEGKFAWVLEGAYRLQIHESVQSSGYHSSSVGIGASGYSRPDVLVELGFEGETDYEGPGIWTNGGPTDYASDFDVQQNTDYRFELVHDGEGDYEFFLWKADESKPKSPVATVTADPIFGEQGLQLSIGSSVEMSTHWHYVGLRTE